MVTKLLRLEIRRIVQVTNRKEVRNTGQIAFSSHLFIDQILNRGTYIGINREILDALVDIHHHIRIDIAIRTCHIRVKSISAGQSPQSRGIALLLHTIIRVVNLNTTDYIHPIGNLIS